MEREQAQARRRVSGPLMGVAVVQAFEPAWSVLAGSAGTQAWAVEAGLPGSVLTEAVITPFTCFNVVSGCRCVMRKRM